jgi:uncharacterized membrane protein
MLKTKNLESLGFVFLKKEGTKPVFRCNISRDETIYFGEIYGDKKYIAIKNNCDQFLFRGWLKNKKELKKILEQVCVGFNNANSKRRKSKTD